MKPGTGGRTKTRSMRHKLLTAIDHADLRQIVGTRYISQNRTDQEYAALAGWDAAVESAVLTSIMRELADEAAAAVYGGGETTGRHAAGETGASKT